MQNFKVIILGLLVIILGTSASDITTDYPDFLHEIFSEPLYRFITIISLFYLCSKDYHIGLVVLIIFTLINTNIPLVSNSKPDENFINGPPVANCHSYNSNQIETPGTAFYPLNDNNNSKHFRSGIESEQPKYDNNF